MSYISLYKQTWRISIIVLLLLATVGPWTFDRIYVPAEYPCSNSIRLEGNFCGIPLPGIQIIPWVFIGTINAATRLITGELAFAQGVRDLLFALLFILLFFPIVSSLLLSVNAGSRRWCRIHIGILCLALTLGVLFITSSISQPNWALWGLWIYLGLLACVLVLEILALRHERSLIMRVR